MSKKWLTVQVEVRSDVTILGAWKESTIIPADMPTHDLLLIMEDIQDRLIAQIPAAAHGMDRTWTVHQSETFE